MADFEALGVRLGVQCQQRMVTGYDKDPNQPDISPLAVQDHYTAMVNESVSHWRATNGLTDAGEAAYRKGFQRGLETADHDEREEVSRDISVAEDASLKPYLESRD
ncbi:hypothetical protein [Bradyrhizobium sp. CIR3A]|uniref:hypothetical protein n=1 Tax=Bradyrhizobium sp. CIR3A TaxID=2663838 RepID=UPI0016059257|nr:hypothetical protein [Bradyrhizobium sp. CIR3A]MBB4257296.1 hypothetical protein [Bradyrhizobium sp. CIR3A]